VIVTETLPNGWTYQIASTRAADGTGLDEPRLDGDTCCWLFWDASLVDQTFSYRVSAPADSTGTVSFAGVFETRTEPSVTQGNTAWAPLAANEALVRFRRGWNLFSFPTVPDTPTVAAVLGTTCLMPVWNWNGTVYAKADTLAPKQGYWGYFDKETGVVYAGTPAPDPYGHFAQGWNLFGPLADRPLMDRSTLPSPVYYWDGQYRTAADIKTGLGYWIYSSAVQDVDLH